MAFDKFKQIFQPKTDLSNLLKAVQAKDVKKIRFIAGYFQEVDLANWMLDIPTNDQIFFMRSLDNSTASDVLQHLPPIVIEKIIDTFNKEETKDLLTTFYSDEILELVEDLPSDLVKKILESSSKEQRKDINYILNYREGSVGYEMSVDFFSVKINSKLKDIVKSIRQQRKEIEDFQFYYVIDDANTLIGYISPQDLINYGDSNKLVSAIMDTNVVSVRAAADTEQAVQKFNKYSLTELPVVDLQNKLVGILTGEEAVQLIQEEYADDLNKQAGVVQSSDKKYFDISIVSTFWHRIPWLAVTIFISTLSQIIFSLLLVDFEGQSTKLLWFKFILPFVPFILTIVGNVALQSTTLVIKGLILKEIEKRSYRSVLKKELIVSLLVLLVILFLNLPRTLIINVIVDKNFSFNLEFWRNFGQVSVIICLAIILAVFFATGLPILANYFGLDPALMSSPLLTTIIDLLVTGVAVGFSYLIYLWIA